MIFFLLVPLLCCGLLPQSDTARAASYSLFTQPGGIQPVTRPLPSSLPEPDFFSYASRWRPVQIAEEVISRPGVVVGDELVIQAFDDSTLKAVVDRVITDVRGTISIRARIAGYPYGHLLLSSHEDGILGNIAVPELDLHYVITPAPDATFHYAIDLSDATDAALEDGPSLTPPGEPQGAQPQGTEADGPLPGPEDPAEIDVMIVYTPAARAWAADHGGIDAVMAQAMEHAHLVLDNSDTRISMHLIHAAEVAYVESGDSGVDLRRLTWQAGSAADPDGAMDEVHSWRDAHGADLVALFAVLEDVGGRGWMLTTPYGQPQYGFTITRVQQAATQDTHIHEMGHNLGAHHHKEQSVSPGPNGTLNDYSAGWRWVGIDKARYCSVMSYESGSYFADGFTHRRVPFFSNPWLRYSGKATGHLTDGDNARTLRETKHVVAAYRYRPAPTHFLSGFVRQPDGNVIGGVLMEGLPGSPTTDEDGLYVSEIPDKWTGEVTPRKSGFLFDPPNRLYLELDDDRPGEDFTGWACDLADALDSPTLSYLTGGPTNWSCQSTVTLDGADAAGHGPVFHNQETWLESTITGPGLLSFHWKVSSQENADLLEFTVDDERYDAASGEVDWQLRAHELPAGSRIVRWRYVKDAAESRGADCGWIDQVNWIRYYEIVASADPPEGGTVFGGGLHPEGTALSLTPVPNPGYDFVGWMEAGLELQVAAVYDLTTVADRQLVARFALNSYSLTYTAGSGGAIQGEARQTVNHGQDAAPVVAIPDEGWHFVRWSDGLQTPTRQDPAVSGDLVVEAQFAINSYDVRTSVVPPEGGAVFGDGSHTHGAEVSLIAVPNPGYDFLGWWEADQPSQVEPVYVFTALADWELVARFALKRYTLTYKAGNGGSTHGDTPQIVDHGRDAVSVTAVPDEGHHFVQWSDGLQTAIREDRAVTNNLAVEAQFAINEYSMSVSADPTEGGIAFGDGTHLHGAEVALTAVPNPGYDFLGWWEADQPSQAEPVYVFTALADRELVARFALKRYSLTYTAGPGGSIQGTALQTVDHGRDAAIVSAVPDEGRHFVQWSDGLQSAAREDKALTGDLQVEAQFAINTFAITVTIDPPEGGSILGAGSHSYGDEVSLTALPNPGYDFVGWIEAGQEPNLEPVFVLTTLADRELVARFALKRYSLTYTAGPGGSIQGAALQTVDHGRDAAIVSAVPDVGAIFDRWSDGVVTASRQDTGGPADLLVTASFQSAGGVPIDWYAQYGIAPTSEETWSDLDLRDSFEKGMTLREEYIADTDPTDSNSVFRILAVTPGHPLKIRFTPGSTARLYTLQFAEGLASGTWTTVPESPPRPGQGGIDEMEDPEPAPARFYRILVELP